MPIRAACSTTRRKRRKSSRPMRSARNSRRFQEFRSSSTRRITSSAVPATSRRNSNSPWTSSTSTVMSVRFLDSPAPPISNIKCPLADSRVKLSQIQLIVYHYSLADGIGRFLKVPHVIGQNAASDRFVSVALTGFFEDYDRTYPSGTVSKIAFYCPSIDKLNTDILPAVRTWYAVHRPGREDAEIFRFYRSVKKTQKQWASQRIQTRSSTISISPISGSESFFWSRSVRRVGTARA